ncbi:MAG: S41 family peptidase [Acidobacteriota bacterium]|nr:S41 family peptidase [Acidobacteriota bacterium]
MSLKSKRPFFILLLLTFSAALISAQQPAKTAEAASNAKADEAGAAEILEKYVAAIGGRDNFKAVKTIETEAESTVFGMVNKTYHIEDKPTGRFYTRVEGPNGTIEMGFNGQRAWQRAPFFKGYLRDDDPKVKMMLRREPPLYEYKESGKRFVRLPNEQVEGKEYMVVASSRMDQSGREIPVKYYFDPTTYLLRRIVSGADVTQTVTLDDYQKMEGSLVPLTTITETQGAKVTSHVKSIRHNVPLDQSKFEFDEKAKTPSAGEAAKSLKPSNDAAIIPAAAIKPEDVIPEARRVETFEQVWNKINDSYWDKTFGGVDWKAVHDKYAQLVKAAERSDEFHRLLNQMTGELHRSHFKVLPPDKVAGLATLPGEIKNGMVGLSLRWLDGQLVVIDTVKDYPAEAAGIRKGYIISRINGKTPEEIYTESKKKSTGFELREEFARVRAANEQLAGSLDEPVKLEVINEQDKPVTIELKRKPPQRGLNLTFESKMLEGNIAYIKFDVFAGDLLDKFQAAMREMKGARGLIIDLRGNPGGVGNLSTAIASLLSSGEGSLGVSTFRYETQRFSYKGTGDQAFKGPVVLLVDELSGSTSEVFAGGLQENHRATVIGMTTAGAVLPSLIDPLPTGGALQYVISNFQTPKGVVLEGRGVTPDLTAKLTRASLLSGHDPVLERAVEFVKNSK